MQILAEQLASLIPEVRAQYGRCGRKLAYPTMPDAMNAAMKRQKATGIELYGYPCSDGDHWHLSHLAPSADQLAQLEAYAGQDARRAEAELKRRARAVKVCQRQLEAHRAQSCRRQVAPMDTPFPDRIKQHYATLRQDLATSMQLMYSYLTAVVEHDALIMMIQSSAGFDGPCTSWRAKLQAELDTLSADMAAHAERVAEAMDEQAAQLDGDEQRDLAECRAALAERYTASVKLA